MDATETSDDVAVTSYSFIWDLIDVVPFKKGIKNKKTFKGCSQEISHFMFATKSTTATDSTAINLVCLCGALIFKDKPWADRKVYLTFSLLNSQNIIHQSFSDEAKTHNGNNPFGERALWVYISWPQAKFIHMISNPDAELIRSDDNSLRILCEIKIIKISLSLPVMIPTNTKEKADLVASLINLLRSTKFNDVKLITRDGMELEAHKTILAARSSVFFSMFEKEMSKKPKYRIEVDSTSREVTAILGYIYTGEFSGTPLDAANVLMVADKYKVQGLEEKCEEKLTANFKVENASWILTVADTHNRTDLKAFAIDFIVKQIDQVRDTEDFKYLKKQYPYLYGQILRKLDQNNKPEV